MKPSMNMDDFLTISEEVWPIQKNHLFMARKSGCPSAADLTHFGVLVEREALKRASLAQPASVPVDGIDYEKLVADAWSLHKYRCGTPTCVAFKRGAEWQAKQAPQPAQAVPQLTGCNCRWDGETQVQWCELHLAHKEAIHDWAGRAKAAEAKLAAPQPEAQPQKLLGYLSEHTGPDGPYKWQFSKDLFGVYHDTALRVIPVYEPAAPSAQAVPQQADTVTLVGVKADGTEHVLGTATMPPKMRAKELVREMFGSIDEETGDDGAMALWVCEQLIEWMQETSLVVTLTNQAEQGGTK